MGLAVEPYLSEETGQRCMWFRTDNGNGTSTWVQVSREGTIRIHGKHYSVTRACGHVEIQWLPFLDTQFGLECFEYEKLEYCRVCRPEASN